MIHNRNFFLFLSEQKILLFKDIVNFVQLIVFSVVEKMFGATRFDQMRFGLYNRFAWFDESLENWKFDRIKKNSLALVWCLFEIYSIKATKHTFLWVYCDNKPLGMLREYLKSLQAPRSGFTNFSLVLPKSRADYYAGNPSKIRFLA